ncbi:CocE/NonD family hydrolase [Isoalcanivorax indicus]|uniref:CocE/NonD family hydrolase n=1 Tax=Isoalcanivorax indicus TaxID=2202653 RepID=UPI000DB92958|nr:CocE/NonD family hydrolase [Isoalcanivorax indicus]
MKRSRMWAQYGLMTRSAMMIVLSAALTGIAHAQTTTLGTRGTQSEVNPVITEGAGAQWSSYSRNREYPRTATLPLQFIDTPEGGKLAVLVTVPADAQGNPVPGPFPVILTQTAYRIDLGALLGSILPSQTTLLIGGEDQYMIRRGYISVAVDVRGTGMSSGVTALLGEEEQAGYRAAVEWVNQQPWFDGNLGLAGTSYLGIAALQTAAQGHPSVKAVFAQVPMGDPYRDTVVTGGLLNAEFVNLWLSLTYSLSVSNDLAERAYPQHAEYIRGVTEEHVAALDAWYLPTVNNALDNVPGYATDDGAFWAVRSPLESARHIEVPTFLVGASNDIFQRGVPLLYEQIKQQGNTKLLVLKGSHVSSILDSAVGNQLNGGAPGSQQLLLRWFDHYLKGMDTGVDDMPTVTQYVEGYGLLGTQRFATATDWPHPAISPQRYYLRANKRLTRNTPYSFEWPHRLYEPAAPDVSVVRSADGRQLEGSVTVRDHSACSSSGVQWSLGLNGLLPLPCHADNRYVEARQDALVYETAPLLRSMYINGPIQADLWVSATRPHAALAVRVSVVDPLGRATPISTGLMSAAHRKVDEQRARYIDGVMMQPWHSFAEQDMQPLQPNEPVLVPVEIFPAAALIRPGHRLRVSISASNQIQGVWPLPLQALAEGNAITLYNDAQRPSSVVLPVVPVSEL